MGRKVKSRDLCVFCRQFVSITEAGVFFAGSSGEFAVAALFTHDGELDACGVENFHHSARNLLSTAIVTSRTADPIEHVVLDAGLGDFNVKSLGPLQAASGIHTPGIADARSVFQSLSQTFGEVAFFKRQMTAHLNDDVGSRNLSRTDLGAGAAWRLTSGILFVYQW